MSIHYSSNGSSPDIAKLTEFMQHPEAKPLAIAARTAAFRAKNAGDVKPGEFQATIVRFFRTNLMTAVRTNPELAEAYHQKMNGF